jgi:cyclophilin family peptidyl-prolyl cis-trans isomerase
MVKQLTLVLLGLMVLVLVLVIAGAFSDSYYTRQAETKQEQLGRQNAFASGRTYEEWLRAQATLGEPGHEGETEEEHAAHAHEGSASELEEDAKAAAEWAAKQGASSSAMTGPAGEAGSTSGLGLNAATETTSEAPATSETGTPAEPEGEQGPPTTKGQMILPKPNLTTTPEEIEALKAKAVVIHTTVGSIPVEMWPDKAPKQVKNFLYLVKNNFYSGLYFHRFMNESHVMAGSPSGMRGGTAGYWFDMGYSGEYPSIGTLCAMAAPDEPMISSEFAIMMHGGGALQDDCVPFGRVLERYDVVEKIADTSGDDQLSPVDRVYIESIEIVDKAAVAPKDDFWAKYGK